MNTNISNIICGIHSVEEAFSSGIEIKKLYLYRNLKDQNRILNSLKPLCQISFPDVIFVSRNELDKLTGNLNHGGIAAQITQVNYYSLSQLFKKVADLREPAFIVFIDHILDPGNLGGIIRSAECIPHIIFEMLVFIILFFYFLIL